MAVDLQAVFITLHSICLVLNCATISWHIKSHNVPAISLITCLQLMMIKGLVDAIVWGGDNYMTTWDGAVWCDIMIRLQIGSSIGCLCAIFMISFNLYLILLADRFTVSWFSENHKGRKLAVELSICLGFPLIIMGVSYFAQAGRYAIFHCAGCQTTLTRYKITILVYTMWVCIWSIISLVMSILTLMLYFKKRREVRNILNCTNSGLSLRRFAKLLIFCFLVIAALSPFAIFNLVTKVKTSFSKVYSPSIHNSLFWNSIVKLPYSSTIDIDRWIYIAVSFVSFGLFGMSADAVVMYKEFIVKLPFGDKVIEKIDDFSNRKGNKVRDQYMLDNLADRGECFSKICDDDELELHSKRSLSNYKNQAKIDFLEDEDKFSILDSPLTMTNNNVSAKNDLLVEELLRDDDDSLTPGHEINMDFELESDLNSTFEREIRRAEREIYRSSDYNTRLHYI